MTQNIEQRTEVAVTKYENASDLIDKLGNTDDEVQTPAGPRDSFPKLSREIKEAAETQHRNIQARSDEQIASNQAEFDVQISQQASDFQSRFAVSQQSIEWTAQTEVADEFQRYHVGTVGEEDYKEYLPDPVKLPFTTNGSIADDIADGYWLENGVPSKDWTKNYVSGISEKHKHFISSYKILGDGSDSDKALIDLAIANAVKSNVTLEFDVTGVYQQINLINGSNIHVAVPTTLKGNPSTAHQSVTDCLFKISNVDGFSLTFAPSAIMRSQDHGSWQEFSHAINIRDGSKNGYVGKHRSEGFDGDGLYIFNIKNVTIDEPSAYQPGRSGISCTGAMENVTINNPYCEGFNAKEGALNLSAIDIEPNNAQHMDLTINNPSGYGDNIRDVGFLCYLERNQYDASNQYWHLVVNNPRYSNFKRNYNISRSFWDLNTYASPVGSVTINTPTSVNHINNAFYLDSIQAKGGIEVNIYNPSILITRYTVGEGGNDDGRVICITRNQAVYDDPDLNPMITIKDICINDRTNSPHKAYLFVRYARFLNLATFDKLVKVNESVKLIDLAESGRGTAAPGKIISNANRQVAFTESATLSADDCLREITNNGATSDITLTLPVMPFNMPITIINQANGRKIVVKPPENMSIGNLPTYESLVMDSPYQQLTFKRADGNRWVVV